ncbi:MAG: helix-turn-helix domain-containing protein [Pseudomonadales bacterium]|nr:helix-turn-helix domain-containing protein [Pseudomonadales bacterium]
MKKAFLHQKSLGKWKSQAQIADLMGFETQSAVSHYLNGLRPISFEVGVRFCRIFGLDPAQINPDWNMYPEQNFKILSADDIETRFGVKRDPDLVSESGGTEYKISAPVPEFAKIPFYDEVELSMGDGRVVYHEEPEKFLTFRSDWLKNMDVDPQHAVVVTCKGDSMLDRIQDGDAALIKTDITEIEDDRCYAINYGGDAKLKRLLKRVNGDLIIRSDNNDPSENKWPDEIVKPEQADELRIIGMAVWIAGKV